jgi:hypothetical protein
MPVQVQQQHRDREHDQTEHEGADGPPLRPANGPNESVPGKVGKAVKLTGDDGVGTKVGNFRRWEPFSVALWMNTPDEKQRAVVFHRSRAWTDAGSRGYQLLIEDGRLSASLIHFWPGNAIRVCTREKIATGQWLHVAITYDGLSRAAGLRVFVNGAQADCEVIRDSLFKNITGKLSVCFNKIYMRCVYPGDGEMWFRLFKTRPQCRNPKIGKCRHSF